MAEQDLINALNDSIDRLAAGQSIDDCLASYPQFASALRPMLEAGRLAYRAQFAPSEVSQAQARVRLRIEQATESSPLILVSPYRRFLTLAAGLLLAFLMVIGGAGALAQNSLPGDALYGLKLLTENVQLAASAEDAVLQAQFAARRIQEVQQLLALGRPANVTFQGELTAVDGSIWTVAGLSVLVNEQTPGAAAAQIGDTLEVQGFTTEQGGLLAAQIRVIKTGQLPVTPHTPTPTQTLTPEQTTVVPTPTSPPPSLTPTGTPSLTPTLMPTQPPSAIPNLLPAVCATTQPNGWELYTIQAGDTLSGLATSRGITLEQVMAVNCLSEPNRIVAGQRIFLPPAAPGSQGPTSQPSSGGVIGNSNDNNTNDDSNDNDDDSSGGGDDDD